MLGQMMHRDLRIIDILTFAAEAFPEQGVTSVRDDGDIYRMTYPQLLARVGQLARVLLKLGVQRGDRVATLAWNGHRHFELYYGVSGIGAVCHTINPRLPAEQIRYLVDHAEDRVLFVDLSLFPLVESMAGMLPESLQIIVLAGAGDMPETALNVLCYETLLAAEDGAFDWPDLPEATAAGLCYTSGTTGHPKGALYSHRSTVLHALTVIAGHPQSLAHGKTVLPVVPMFHVNAWGVPYTAPLVGMSIVMPGRHLDGASLFDLMDREGVYSAWGVPTVWAGLLQEIETRGTLPRGFADLVVGGSAPPRSMIEAYESRGVKVNQAWGMTETSPVATRGILSAGLEEAPLQDQIDAKSGAGRRIFGVDFKLVGQGGAPVPHDGRTSGELFVRGNAVVSSYFRNDEATQSAFDREGWFGTGDVATLDPNGSLIIRDRAKDLVKSGGEWISSIDLENAALAHPDLAACAVVAVPHPKWDERPVLVAVAAGGRQISLTELHAFMVDHFAKWQLPDDIVYVEALPLTATGKVSKLTLRKGFADYVLPEFQENNR